MFDIDKERDAINANYENSLRLLDFAVDINKVAAVDFMGYSAIFLKPVKTYHEFEQLLKECRLEIAGLHLSRYYLYDGHLVVVYQYESIDIAFSISEEVNKTLEIISGGRGVVQLTTKEERVIIRTLEEEDRDENL